LSSFVIFYVTIRKLPLKITQNAVRMCCHSQVYWENYATKLISTKIITKLNKQSTPSGLINFDYFLIKPNHKIPLKQYSRTTRSRNETKEFIDREAYCWRSCRGSKFPHLWRYGNELQRRQLNVFDFKFENVYNEKRQGLIVKRN